MAWNKNTPIEKIREYNRKYYLEKTKQKRAEKEKPPREPKECPICHSTFIPKSSNQKYCSPECSKVSARIKDILYRSTKEYKEKMQAYRQTEEYKAKQKELRQTEKYKEYRKKYAKSETYKAVMKKYLQSEKGKATVKKYQQKRKAERQAVTVEKVDLAK